MTRIPYKPLNEERGEKLLSKYVKILLVVALYWFVSGKFVLYQKFNYSKASVRLFCLQGHIDCNSVCKQSSIEQHKLGRPTVYNMVSMCRLGCNMYVSESS